MLRVLFLRIGSLPPGAGAQIVLREAAQLMARESGASDWTRGLRGCLTWGIPVAVLVITPERYLVIVWPAALTFMGLACLLNSRRCGRIHCYATGPFFLLLAVLGLLYGTGLLALGGRGWTRLSIALVIGSVVLICLLESVFGRYRAASNPVRRT